MNAACIIMGASPQEDGVCIKTGDGDLIIAADGGYTRLKNMGVTPHVLIGDFDSLEGVPQDTKVIPHPKEKDDTDMMLAIRYGLDKGYQTFRLYGGLGGRIDHMMANIQALTFLARGGARGTLIGQNVHATVICRGGIRFSSNERGILSVFALDNQVYGVTERGLQYPLTDAVLTNAFPVGVSNAFIGQESDISVRDGALLIIWQRDASFLFNPPQ